jgi:carbamoyltransferase
VASDDDLMETTAAALARGMAVGWFQGRMEFGPRALGNRSILADPRRPEMQSLLNRKIKFRESFRPFAPAVLLEEAAHWFEIDEESPYMLIVANVRAEHGIPAVTHVDNSARIQTVDRERNPRFHALLSEFHRLTGCPVLVNTSFNVRGEPIVCTPADAFRCFMSTDLDLLSIGDCVVWKTEQTAPPSGSGRRFEPD